MKRILIVDDDEDVTLGLSIRFTAAGYGVLVAHDGAGAMRAAVDGSPDLIVRDVGIPGGNGFVVLDLLKDTVETANIPTIVLTGRDPASTRDKVLGQGAVRFFQKPVANDALLNAIRDVIGGDETETH